jgi:hypothetical protein
MRHTMRLFDDDERTDGSPKKASEDSFAFLNRAAGPFWAAIRDELEHGSRTTQRRTHRI